MTEQSRQSRKAEGTTSSSKQILYTDWQSEEIRWPPTASSPAAMPSDLSSGSGKRSSKKARHRTKKRG
jgi:hypothetical protein